MGQGKDSGVECLEDFASPDPELIDKIVTQIESYFSDDNLSKDAFLLKHIRRNTEGYVSLKLVSSFRKVKALTKNWKVVAFSIMNGSKKLSVNDSLTKVRRLEALPDAVLGARIKSKTLIAYNMPLENTSIAFISQAFADYGEVSSVKLFRSGVANNYMHLLKKATDFNGNGFAVVEYETAEEADNAVEKVETTGSDSWRKVIKVFLVEESTKSKAREEVRRPQKSRSHTFCEQPMSNSFSRTRSFHNEPSRDARRPRSQTTVTFAKEDDRSGLNQAKERASFTFQRKRATSTSDASSVVRNHSRFASLNKENCSSSPADSKSDVLVRQPKGPDGTRGFLDRVPIRRDRSTSTPFTR
jgi:la-related protein 6